MLGWGRAAPEAALEWVENQQLGTAHSGLRTTVIEAMAERNPAAALELMKSRGWLGQHPRAMLKLLQNWGGTEPAAALEGLRGTVAEMKLTMDMRVSGPSESFRAMLGALLYGVFERNPREAQALLAQLTPEELANGQDAISSEILARDPEASEAIVSRPADPATRSLLRGLAEKNAEAAVSLLPRIEDKSLQVELLTAAAGSPYSQNPLEIPEELRPTVMAALSAMTDAQARGRLIGRMCADNAGTSPAWAAEIWSGLPLDQQLRQTHRFFRALAESDPGAAVVVFQTAGPEVQAQSLKSVCFGMAATDPTKALRLVLAQSDAGAQAECAATLFAFWADKDAIPALAALDQSADAFDLEAVLPKLPSAGQFRDASTSFHHAVSTVGVERRIGELLETSAPRSP